MFALNSSFKFIKLAKQCRPTKSVANRQSKIKKNAELILVRNTEDDIKRELQACQNFTESFQIFLRYRTQQSSVSRIILLSRLVGFVGGVFIF